MTEIEKVKGEIKVLEKKLALLEEMENYKSPVEKSYRDAYGKYPVTDVSMSDWDAVSWSAFQKGYEAAQLKDVGVPECPDEPYRNVRAYWDEKDNPASYITDEVVNRLVEKHKSQKLWNILSNKYDYISATCDDIISAVEEWLPKEQSAAGSQNVDTELLVDGFNDCLRKIKEMLR
jgi:hypothetical protein